MEHQPTAARLRGMRSPPSALLAALLVLIAVGCAAEPEPSTETLLTAADFSRSGGCGDAILWATNQADTLAVIINRPAAATTAQANGEFRAVASLPAAEASVRIQLGRHLSDGFCSDIVMPGRPQVLGEVTPRAGEVEIIVRPEATETLFSTGRATLLLTDVVFEFGSGDNAERWRIDRLELRDISVGWLPG